MRAWQWSKTLLPSWKPTRWTWSKIFLLAFAVFSLVDSLFIPMSRNVDPGRASEGILFLILTFRAASRQDLPTSVLFAGGFLSMLVAGLNHGLITSPSLLWTPLVFILLVYVMLWGRRKRKESPPEE
jgi:hypothetical protein